MQSMIATVTDGSTWTVYVGDRIYCELVSGKQADGIANELRPLLKQGVDVWDYKIVTRILGPIAAEELSKPKPHPLSDVPQMVSEKLWDEVVQRQDASIGRLHGELALHTTAFNANVIEFTKGMADLEQRLSALEKKVQGIHPIELGGVPADSPAGGAPASTGSERSGADGSVPGGSE